MTTDQTATTPSLASVDPEVQDVKIRMLGPGHAEVLLHGIDIAPDLVGFQLTAPDPRGLPELVLMLGPRVASRATYEGMARVVVGEPADPGPAAATFLAAMDPGELERTALGRLDMTSEEHGTTAAILRQLIEWANGRA